MTSGQTCQEAQGVRRAASAILGGGDNLEYSAWRAAVDASEGEAPDAGGGADETLEDAARGEREYVRGRVREELGREPTEEEVDEWLSEHTEGY